MYLEFNNNNGHLKRLTHTGPKRLHSLEMYLEFNINNNNGYPEPLTRTDHKRLRILYDVLGV